MGQKALMHSLGKDGWTWGRGDRAEKEVGRKENMVVSRGKNCSCEVPREKGCRGSHCQGVEAGVFELIGSEK